MAIRFVNKPLGWVTPIGPLKRGPKPKPDSERQSKPWLALKISQRTYYRLKKEGKL